MQYMKLTKDMSNPIRAVAVFNDKKINGLVYFTEEPSKSRVRIDVSLTGLNHPVCMDFMFTNTET